MKRLLFSFLALVACCHVSAVAAASDALRFGPATWYQPAANFPAAKARGITTIVGYAATVTLDAWAQALQANGLTAWCQYTAETSAYFAAHPERRSVLLGWLALPDEPNGSGNRTPGQVADEVRSIRAAWPGVPILVNLDGRPLRYAARADVAAYAHCGADAVAFDIYPANQGDVAPGTIGALLDLIHATGPPDLPVIVVLEDGDQDLRASDWGRQMTAAGTVMRGPTLDEVRAEAAESIAHGAAGAIWFEQVIGAGWERFYGVTPAIEAQIPSINAALTPAAPAAVATTRPAAPPSTKPIAPVWQLEITITINGVVYDLVPRR